MGVKVLINQQEALLPHPQEEDQEEEEPLSPKSQSYYTDVLNISNLAFYEFETEIVDTSKIVQHLELIESAFNSRFSSIVVRDEKGVLRWRRTKPIVENHVKIPSFPDGLSPKDYDKYLEDYTNKISKERFLEAQPLWEVHLIKYPTSNSPALLVFKLHHALGDGYSLMGNMLSWFFGRADDPSLPLTFPVNMKKGSRSTFYDKAFQFVCGCWNTILDLGEIVLQGVLQENDRTVIRSGKPRLEFEPSSISSISLSLEDIALVRSRAAATVNDIVMATTFYGIRLYMQKMGQSPNNDQNVTSLVLLNTRMLSGYQSVDDMAKASTYGNRISFMFLRVPSSGDVDKLDPMEFVYKAKKMMTRKKNSMAILLISRVLQMLGNIKGPEEVASNLYSRLEKASFIISNLVGPKEKMALAGYPVKGFYFVTTGLPMSLGVSIMSYMGQLRLVIRVEKDFIDSELLVSCMKEAFDKIFESTCAN